MSELDLRAETITRPNGKLYRPTGKLIRARAWETDDARGDYGVVVLGTLSVERATPFALEACRYWYGWNTELSTTVEPEVGWWRDGFYYRQRTWLSDEVRGAPGVMFWATG